MIRVGIIGCGGIANAKHMPALAQLPDVEMVAFCDIKIERAQKALLEYGAAGARAYSNFHTLLAHENIDVIHVCTPNISHAVISIAALEAGKHVMCEKPMAKTSAEAQAMVDAAQRTGKKLTIGYQNRFRKDSRYLHQVCENGDLGEIYYAKAKAIRRRAVPTWGVFLDEEAQGGGPLIDIGTHALDLTLWMMGNYQPRYVVGNTYHKLSSMKDAANAWGPWDPEQFTVEDSAFGFITMEDGATIILESSWALNTLDIGEAKTALSGTKGGADMLDGLRINGEAYGATYEQRIQLGADGVDFYDATDDDPALQEAKAWIAAVRDDTPLVVTPQQALVVTQILEAIYQSAATGQPVYFS